MSFIEELKRRNVFRVGIAYVVVGWLVTPDHRLTPVTPDHRLTPVTPDHRLTPVIPDRRRRIWDPVTSIKTDWVPEFAKQIYGMTKFLIYPVDGPLVHTESRAL